VASKRHASSRLTLGLPPEPPRSSGVCYGRGRERGYCGIRSNRGGSLHSPARQGAALLHYYLYPHVTNCCNAYFEIGNMGLLAAHSQLSI